MGNFTSKPETNEPRRARLQRDHGILLPPSFVNGSQIPIAHQAALQASQAMTPSIVEYLWETNPGTRLLQDYVQPGIAMRIPTSPASGGGGGGEILVGLQPIPKPETAGSSINAAAATTTTPAAPTTTTVPSSVPPPLDPSTPTPPTNKVHHTSSIIATHSLDPLQLRIHIPTSNHHAPSIQISSQGSNFSLNTRLPLAVGTTGSNNHDPNSISMDPNGGWMEVRYKRNSFWKDQVDFVASTWMTMNSLQTLVQQSMTRPTATTTTTTTTWTPNSTPPTVQLQAGLEYQQSVVAAQTSLPLTNQVLAGNLTELVPKIDTMVSINLNHHRTPTNPSDSNYFPTSNRDYYKHADHNYTDDDDSDDDKTHVAPLWLSLKHSASSSLSTSSKWVMNLSQVLTFDRPVMNPFDERAPNIRQTLGWVVQVEKESPTPPLAPMDHAFPTTTTTSPTNKTSWSAGATFQLNRNTACKAVLMDGHTLLYGAILKRWSQPRLTLSLFHSIHLPTGQQGPFGFGLELETATPTDPTDPTMPTHPKETTEYPPQPTLPSTHGPKTKIRIPKHTR